MMRHHSQRSTIRRAFVVGISVAGCVAVFFSACKKPAVAGPRKPTVRVQRQLAPAAAFSEARQLIENGNYVEAAEAMRSLNARKDVPASIQDWVLMYGGFAELLVDKEADARPLFAKLAERSSGAKDSGKLAKFLADLGEKMSGDAPVPGRVASQYDRGNHEALALYFFALKDESLNALEEAVTHYRQFATAQAKGPDLWAGFNAELRKLRQTATDICEYEELVDAATRSRAVAAGEGAVERAVSEAKAVRQRIKREGKLMASLDAQLGDKTKVMAEQDDADAEVFPAAKAKWAELAAKYEFGEAMRAIFEAKLTTAKRKKEQEILSARARYLEQFKFYLVLELRTDGYPKPVFLKNGATVEGGIAKMDDTHLYLRDKAGEREVKWNDVSPESIFEMAKSLVTPDEEANKAAFRKWHLGNYAAFIGKDDEARKLMNEAVQANPQYEPEVAGLLEATK